MNKSSTAQLDLFLEATRGAGSTGTASESAEAPPSPDIEFPQFGSYSDTRAETARIAGRIIASQVTEGEHRELLKERQALVQKLLDKTISRRESIRLEYVRWSLDRIEDARHGADLDRIEDSISRYERFLSDLETFKQSLANAVKRRR